MILNRKAGWGVRRSSLRRSLSRVRKGFPMAQEVANAKLWSLTGAELAEECRAIAHDGSAKLNQDLKAEAERLYAGWQEALEKPVDDFDDRARHASQIAALRKRTIEVLIKIHEEA